MKRVGKVAAMIECMLVGGILSSLLILNSDTWKYYLVLILLMNSFRSVHNAN